MRQYPGTPEHRAAAAARAARPDRLTPADRYQELFVDVQSSRLFSDSKTFVDCIPRRDPQEILQAYRARKHSAGFDLGRFTAEHFDVPPPLASTYVSVPGRSLPAHIDALWPALARSPRQHPPACSLLPLPHFYVVPGGRFTELYYWDSYFTMLGLAESGRPRLLRAMVDNFAYLIDTYGHVPNGTRSYYLSRSQPPVFALMVELGARCGGLPPSHYLPQLRREYAYWMDGAAGLRPGEATRRVVRLADGSLLNRYWDDRDSPREESYLEDVHTAAGSPRPAGEVYRDLRAAAESGWDFSSRWLREGPCDDGPPSLSNICTTAILPVDLNAFLFKLECCIAGLSRQCGDTAAAERHEALARARAAAVRRLMWQAQEQAFFDYDFHQGRQRRCLTAATAVPLFTGLANRAEARGVADILAARLLAPGGLATTEHGSGQQWDRPNGWAPLQWMAIRGLERHGLVELSQDITQRWLSTVSKVYRREGKLVEKYTLRETPDATPAGGGGGEYPLQDGFGWTNGVTRRLMHEHPAHPACASCALS